MPTYEELHPQSDEDQNQGLHQDQPTRGRCRHIFTAGRRCGSPCLRHTDFCYYHHNTRRPVKNPRERRNRIDVFDLPNPEDRDGARAAVTQIMHAIAHNNIDLKRAGMLLYSLQISLCTLPPQPRPAPLKTAANHIPLKDIVEDVVYEEPHGFIAPEDDYEEPEELKPRKSLARQLYEEVERYEARQAVEKEAEEEARRLQDVEETQEELRRCQAARDAQQAPAVAHRPAAIDLRASAGPATEAGANNVTLSKKCHPERSLARNCAKRSRRICGPAGSPSIDHAGEPLSKPFRNRHSERSPSQRSIARDGGEESRRGSTPPLPGSSSHKDSRSSPCLSTRLQRVLKDSVLLKGTASAVPQPRLRTSASRAAERRRRALFVVSAG